MEIILEIALLHRLTRASIVTNPYRSVGAIGLLQLLLLSYDVAL